MNYHGNTGEGDEIVTLTIKKSITNDQLKTSPLTAVELIPPTEILNFTGIPKEVIIPDLCIGKLTVEDVYDDVNPPCKFYLAWGSDFGFLVCGSFTHAGEAGYSNQLGSEGNTPVWVPFNGVIPYQGQIPSDLLLDNGLYFWMDNGAEELSGGGDNNKFDLIVNYRILRLP